MGQKGVARMTEWDRVKPPNVISRIDIQIGEITVPVLLTECGSRLVDTRDVMKLFKMLGDHSVATDSLVTSETEGNA
jgi:hypothetical protein